MTEEDLDDVINVHCGKCGKPLTVRIVDVKGKRTIDCPECEKLVPEKE